MKGLILILISFCAIGIVSFVYLNAVEIEECRKWQEYAVKFEGFYLVAWQAEQCQAHNIIIDAPIK